MAKRKKEVVDPKERKNKLTRLINDTISRISQPNYPLGEVAQGRQKILKWQQELTALRGHK